MFYNSNPEKYGEWLDFILNSKRKTESEFIFINAWNEWAEGNYLEPDTRFGSKFLEAIKIVVEKKEYD